MKILVLTHYFPPEVNAPASRTYDNAKRWVSSGHSVTVVTCAPNCPDGIIYNGYKNKLKQAEIMDGIKVIRVWTYIAANKWKFRRGLNYLSYFISAVWYCLFIRRPDLLIATSPQILCGFAGVIIKKARNIRFLLEVRDIWPASITTVGAMKKGFWIRFLERMEKYMYRAADHIIAVGQGYKNHIVDKGVGPEKIDVIYNGVDLAFYSKNINYKNPFPNIDTNGKKIVAYVGTIGMAHALEVVLRAARKTLHEPWVYMFIGSGARKDELEKQVWAEGLKNVCFTGRIQKIMMPAVWNYIDISFIHLKKSKLFQSVIPSKMFEAMAMEKPVILGVQGEAAQLIGNSKAGYTITPGNEDELIDKVRQLLQSPEESRKMGANGRRFVENKFNRDVLAKKYLEVMTAQCK